MTTVIIDYESGNLRSAEKSFQRMSVEVDGGAVIGLNYVPPLDFNREIAATDTFIYTVIDQSTCIKCRTCITVCTSDAIF